MKLATILLCVAYVANAKPAFSASDVESAASYFSTSVAPDVNGFSSVPLVQSRYVSSTVSSTPVPNIQNSFSDLNQQYLSSQLPAFQNEYSVSSTQAPDVNLRLSAPSASSFQNVQELNSINIPVDQTSFSAPSSSFQNIQAINIPVDQTKFFAPASSFQNVQELGSINIPVDQTRFSAPVSSFQNEQELNAVNVQLDQARLSLPASRFQNVQELNSVNLPVDQARLLNFNYNQQLVNSGDVERNSQFSLESKFGGQGAIVKATTSGGSIDEAFGGADQENLNQETELLKNYYFFTAPEEPEAIQPRINFVQPAKQRLNIIFIKAPDAPRLRPVQVSAPEVKQDKTVVYVLVKKPELNQEITVKAGAVAQPRKPEIFFLKYNTEEEAREAVNKIKGEDGSGNEQIALTAGENEESGLFTGSQVQVNGLSNVQSVPGFVSDRSSVSSVDAVHSLQTGVALPVRINLTPSVSEVQVNSAVEDGKNEVVNIGSKYVGSTVSTVSSVSNDAPYVSGSSSYHSSTALPSVVSSTTQRYLQSL